MRFEILGRRRQAAFQGISAKGRSPDDAKGQRNPHLLALGCEEENLYPGIRGAGGAIEFFCGRSIKWWQSSRSGDDSRTNSPTRNMASSQVACVNFMLPLADVSGALTAILRAIDDDVRRVVVIPHQGRTSPVEFEWVGIDSSDRDNPLEGVGIRGANATSIDAFLVAETDSGLRRAYLLEWKYVEQYLSTKPENKGDGSKGKTRWKRYGSLYSAQDSSFNQAVGLGALLYEPFYQLTRQRLLADRMVRDSELCVQEAKVVVVVPEENQDYRMVQSPDGKRGTSPCFPELNTVDKVMRAVLKEPDKQFAMVTPSMLLDSVVRANPDETAAWAAYWRERYGV